MKIPRNMTGWSIMLVVTLLCGRCVLAQEGGFISSYSGGMEELLPPGAVYEGAVVLHPISSQEENLHLLAGYYYGNPREWKRIYQDNRKIIRNPNRLPVGQTLKIQVGETWKPKFSYEEWFRLANRNGQWETGKPWRRARESAAIPSTSQQQAVSDAKPPKTPPAQQPAPQAETPPPVKQKPVAAPTQQETPKAEQQPPTVEETPEEEAPPAAEQQPPTVEETPEEEVPPAAEQQPPTVEETPEEEAPPVEETPQEEETSQEEEAAPAF